MNQVAKIPLMVLSFLLAIILWVTVQVQEHPPKEPKTSYPIPITTVGLPESMQIINKPDSIKIFPAGPTDEWARVADSDLSATVDLSGAQKGGPRSYPIKITVKGEHVGLRWSPRSLDAVITVDRRITKLVPVIVQPSNGLLGLDSWYVPESTYTEPAEIAITGPETDVKEVVAARTTLNLENVAPGRTYTSKVLDLLEAHDRVAPVSVDYDRERTVDIHPAIVIGVQAREAYVMPDYKGFPAPGFSVKSIEISPNKVQIHGQPEALSKSSYVKVEVDLTNLKQTQTLLLTPKPVRSDVFMSVPAPEISVKVVIEAVAPPRVTPKAEVRPRGHRRRSSG